MVIWDFDEDKNYIEYNGYKVLDAKDYKKAVKLLEDIEITIRVLFEKLEQINDERIKLLINTPFQLQEMQKIKDQGTIKFVGLNKPKNIYKSNNKAIGNDKKYRAGKRLIFLTLRNKGGKLKNINNLKRLIAHELTHTALNHVTWKDDNHSEEFYQIYNLLLILL